MGADSVNNYINNRGVQMANKTLKVKILSGVIWNKKKVKKDETLTLSVPDANLLIYSNKAVLVKEKKADK